MPEIVIEDWFRDFVAAMKVPPKGDPEGTWTPIAKLAIEALSDASAEQLLNPIAASHLRHYGQERYGHAEEGFKGPWFWVRSEWCKVDISYGVANEAFKGGNTGRGWDVAWSQKATGDLGLIEAKVCYSHLDIPSRVGGLAAQLKDRRSDNVDFGMVNQRYLGIIWCVQHGERTDANVLLDTASDAMKANGLVIRAPFQPIATNVNLGYLWPSLGAVKPYYSNVDVALGELK